MHKPSVYYECNYRPFRDLLYGRLGLWIFAYRSYLESSIEQAHKDIYSGRSLLRSSVSLDKPHILPLGYANLKNSAGVATIIRIPYIKVLTRTDEVLFATT